MDKSYYNLFLKINSPIKAVDGKFPSLGQYGNWVAVEFNLEGAETVNVTYCIDFNGDTTMHQENVITPRVVQLSSNDTLFDMNMPISI